MKKTILYLLIAITGNALGTAIMEQTHIGMTAWGSSALNTANYFNISLGNGFIVLSTFFYLVAVIIARKVVVKNMILSFIFLFSFAYVTDLFIYLIPDFINLSYWLRILLNLFGLLILLFSIAVHLRIQIAVHPMDVFLYEMQKRLNNIALGTYLSYFIGFSLGIIFGLLHGSIEGIGIGTVFTLTLSGIIMKLYNQYILEKWFDE